MLKRLWSIVLIITISCGYSIGQSKYEVFSNDRIDPAVKATITKLNKQAYKSMVENNYDSLSLLLADTFKTMLNAGFTGKFMPSMQRIMKGHEYRVFDEFYIKNAKHRDTIKLSSGTGDEAYTIKMTNTQNDIYYAMLISGNTFNEVMLGLTYQNTNNKWQLVNITGEDYSLKNKNVIQLYRYSQALQKKGHLMDAINIMSIAQHCLKPGGSNFTYTKEDEIKEYGDTLFKQTMAKYPFPYRIEGISTNPAVVGIRYEMEGDDLAPMIVYQSIINVLDSTSLEKENKLIQKQIGNTFSGIDKNNKILLYRVYNVLPDGQNDPRYFGFLQKVN